jgi:hypothetical protein
MIEIQLRDACFSCNGRGTFRSKEVISSMCTDCEGQGSIYSWITIEKLSDMVAEAHARKSARFDFSEEEHNLFNNPKKIEEIQINPNPNI